VISVASFETPDWSRPSRREAEYMERAERHRDLLSLLLTGALAAFMGGAPVLRGAIRLVFWGAMAMAATNLVGRLFDARI